MKSEGKGEAKSKGINIKRVENSKKRKKNIFEIERTSMRCKEEGIRKGKNTKIY